MGILHSVSRSSMHLMRPLRLGAASAACALVLFAADSWKTKDASQWTSEEINKILNDSPWAKSKTVQPEQTQMRRGGGGGGRAGVGFGGGGSRAAVAAAFPAAVVATQAGRRGWKLPERIQWRRRVAGGPHEPDHPVGQRAADSAGSDAPRLRFSGRVEGGDCRD